MERKQSPDIPVRSPLFAWERRLGRRSPVRLWLKRRQEHLPEGSAAALLDLLERHNNLHKRECMVGYEAIATAPLSPEERKRAVTLLLRTIAAPKTEETFAARLRRSVAIASLIGIAYTFLSALRMLLSGDPPPDYFPLETLAQFLTGPWAALPPVVIQMTVLLTPFCYGWRALQERRWNARVQRSALHALAAVGSSETVVALCTYLSRPDAQRPTALQTLRTLLHAISAPAQEALPVSCHVALRNIASFREEEIALAALDALAHRGDFRDAAFVKRLAHATPSSRVRERAHAILPILNARSEQDLPPEASSCSDPVSAVRKIGPEPGALAENGSSPFAREEEKVSEPLPSLRWERVLHRNSFIALWLRQRRAGSDAASADCLLEILESSERVSLAGRMAAYQALGAITMLPSERVRAVTLLLAALAPPAQAEAILARLGNSVLMAAAIGFFTGFQYWPRFEKYTGCNEPAPSDAFYDASSLGLFLAIPLCYLCLSLYERQRLGRIQQTAATTLARVGDPDCLVALWDHVCRRTPARRPALQALREILPSITADWYGKLPGGSGAALTALAESKEEELALAALNALEQAGGGDAAAAVARLAQSAESEHVRERAAAVLPVLLARKEQEGAASSLLRPSAAVSSDHLLKPAYGGTSEDSHLLRAAQALAGESKEALDGTIPSVRR